MESGIKRTPRDCTLAFKLSVVEQVEKANSPTKRHSGALASKDAPLFGSGCTSMVINTGAPWHPTDNTDNLKP